MDSEYPPLSTIGSESFIYFEGESVVPYILYLREKMSEFSKKERRRVYAWLGIKR